MIVACALISRAKITKSINFREAILITLIILKIIYLTQVTIFSENIGRKHEIYREFYLLIKYTYIANKHFRT